MPKLIISLLLIHFINFAAGQNQIKKFVEQTAVSIPTIDPDSTNFSDLEVIGNAIGDSRIVMLGEQDHGDIDRTAEYLRQVPSVLEARGREGRWHAHNLGCRYMGASGLGQRNRRL